MVSPKLSAIEAQRIIKIAEDDIPMERASTPINDHIEYKAFAGSRVLFVALIEEAFESLWRSAHALYKTAQKEARRKRK